MEPPSGKIHHAGKDWSMDSDYGTAPADAATAYLTMLAIDCLLNTVTAVEKLTDVAVEEPAVSSSAAGELICTLGAVSSQGRLCAAI